MLKLSRQNVPEALWLPPELIAYYRLSIAQQSRSELGLEAQQATPNSAATTG